MACDISQSILLYLEKNGKADTVELAEKMNEDHQKIVGAVKSLQSLGDIIKAEQINHKDWKLTEEGKIVSERGSHEALVYYAIPPDGIVSQAQIMKEVPNAKVGFSKAMSSGWICIDKGSGNPVIKRKVSSITDTVKENISLILKGESNKLPDALKQDYKKRKLIEEVITKRYSLEKGSEFRTSIVKSETDLNSDMIASGLWSVKNFKAYNFDAFGVSPSGGHLHPLLKVRSQFRQIFLEMGFSEMPANNFVESSFWNFDALFQPQQHPARDAHDTFFLTEPKLCYKFENEYLNRVKNVHSKGGYGSRGYNYEWKIEEAQKNLLRTHTTAVSARMLHGLAQKGFHPVKYFSIDRVFRNETLDATHLAEFHQVEGVVADINLTLGNLIGIMQEFFGKLGIEKLKFKPTYNPYTEPSMEVYCFHNGLKKWIEVGNSGVFRPEMLLPMGLPENVTVIAWGLSLERPTMIKYGIDNIRDLVGPKVNLQMVQDNPLCRLDKTHTSLIKHVKSVLHQWDDIFKELKSLHGDVESLKASNVRKVDNGLSTNKGTHLMYGDHGLNLCIFADPVQPPYALDVLMQMIGKQYKMSVSVFVHSSMQNISDDLKNFFSVSSSRNKLEKVDITIRLIWKSLGIDPSMIVSPVKSTLIVGEVNIARYLSYLIDGDTGLNFGDLGSVNHILKDQWLDSIHRDVIHGKESDFVRIEKLINAKLNESPFIMGDKISVVDICLWSALKNKQMEKMAKHHHSEWYNRISQYVS